MAKGFSLRVHKEMLDFYFNAGTNTSPGTNLYIGLHTADPGDCDTGDDPVSEVADPASNAVSYARVNFSNWTTATETGAGTSIAFVENGAVITFAQASGVGWGVVTHAAIYTSATAQTAAAYLGRAELSTSRTISSGDTASFASGALDIQLTQTA